MSSKPETLEDKVGVPVSQELSKLERQLELVVQTGLQLTKTHDLKKIVQSATDAGLELCGAQFGAFFYNVINSAGESYQLYVLSGADREVFSRFPMPRNTALFAETFVGSRIIRSGDITADPRYGLNAPYGGMPPGHLPVRSYLAVPVKGQTEEVLGCLLYGHSAPDIFQESAERLVATVAAQAAVAIENVRLREQLTRKVEDLQAAQECQRVSAKRMGELAAIVENSEDAILSKGLNGVINSWNDAATRILGYTQKEMIGESILKIIPEDMHSDEQSILEKVRRGERIEHFETVRRTKSGKLLDVALTISPIKDENGAVIGASKILRDISGKKKLEQSLIQAEKIAATGRMAATIAHEINNPLEAVVNLLYLLRTAIKNDEGLEYLATAESEIARVSHIAKQSLGYYREHSSAVRVSVSDLVEHAATIYEPRCMASGIRLYREIDQTTPLFIRRGEMMQVISNLIANSIYAMSPGGVMTLSVKADAGGVLIGVTDNGTGIAQQHLSRVFDAFFTTRSTIGTGIGLFVAKQFVEGHGGSITIRSSVDPDDHGTTAEVTLPLHTAYENEAGAMPKQ